MESQTVLSDKNRVHLISITLEVLHQITSNLTTLEYGKLRCTCKQIESSLFNSFSREFFTKRKFMFTDFSLQALVDISKSRFSSRLSHVIFGLERPSLVSLSSTTQMLTNGQFDMRVQTNRILEEYADHASLVNTGQDVEMLVEAFSNLKNLESVGIRDFNSRSRYRDHPNIEWKSYGVPTFELHTGTQLEVQQHPIIFDLVPSNGILDRAAYPNRIFLNIFRALGRAGSQPRHFEVILRERSLYDHAFNLPKYVEPLVQPVLANLRTLFLDLSSGFPPALIETDDENLRCHSYLLRRFLSRVPQLEHLRLNFQFYAATEAADVLSWFSESISVVNSETTSGGSIHESPPPIYFSKLRQLDIGMVLLEPHILLAIINKYRATLRVISFHKVSLLHADSVKSGDKVNLWAKFFGQVSKLDLDLSAVNLSFIAQEYAAGQHFQSITFKDPSHPKSKRWAGTDVQSCLRDFTNYMMIDWLEYDSDSSLSETGTDDSGDSISDIQSNGDDDDETVENEMDLF